MLGAWPTYSWHLHEEADHGQKECARFTRTSGSKRQHIDHLASDWNGLQLYRCGPLKASSLYVPHDVVWYELLHVFPGPYGLRHSDTVTAHDDVVVLAEDAPVSLCHVLDGLDSRLELLSLPLFDIAI